MKLCIAICTYRRENISDTLQSIAEQRLPSGSSLKVVVADNDDTTIASSYIQKLGKHYNLKLVYIHAPFRNISIARNACLDNAKSDLLLFIDDDEIASNDWIISLLSTFEDSKADVIFGPVKAVYDKQVTPWIKEGNLHSTAPVFVDGIIQTGYTGNTLLNLNSKILEGERFDLRLGRSGGEDSDYFSRLFNKGANLDFCPLAEVTEAVPKERATLNWLIKRKFRSGQTCGTRMISKNESFIFLLSSIIKASGKFCLCMLMSFISIYQKSKMFTWFLRGVLHLGVISKMLGKSEIVQY
jgi:succinoglycan biosynthesis protein ExoM